MSSMKREHVTLPTLQLAATAFFALNCQAKPYCVNKSTSEVVETENCHSNGDMGDFTMIDAPPDDTFGAAIERRDNTDMTADDLAAMAELVNKIYLLKLAAGGFGKRGSSCSCDSSGQRGGSGGGGFVGGVAAGGNRGGRGSRGG